MTDHYTATAFKNPAPPTLCGGGGRWSVGVAIDRSDMSEDRLQLELLGYLILFAHLTFISQRQSITVNCLHYEHSIEGNLI